MCFGAGPSIDRPPPTGSDACLSFSTCRNRLYAHLVANTYSQIYIQVVFAVQCREYLIRPEFREEVQKYMAGIIAERGQKLLSIYCMPDHTHLLVALKPAMALSDLVRDIKNASSNFINSKGWVMGRFFWQEGFGAFSYAQSQVPGVIRYIQTQPEHHARWSFRDEYLRFLKRFEVDHDERFIFKDVQHEPSGDSGSAGHP